jgi:hypothetical protein
MTKRQFFTKALLASLLIARDMLPAAARKSSSYLIEEGSQRLAAIAAQLAEAATLEWETQLVIWDETDQESKLDPEHVDSHRDMDAKPEGSNN